MSNELYLVRISGEIAIKSRPVRREMESLVKKHIVEALKKNNMDIKRIDWEPGRIFIEAPKGAENILCKVFGVSSVSPAKKYRFKSLEELASIAENLYGEVVKNKRFAIRCRRVGDHPFTSLDVARIIGARLRPYSKGVDLTNPDVEIFVEIRNWDAYFFTKKINGPGGLPIGPSGYVLSLFSGGFDSPVAAWYIMKRGCKVDFLHIVMGSWESAYRAFVVAKNLYDNWCFGYSPKFMVLNFGSVIAKIRNSMRERYWQVALRRAMYIAADIIARSRNYDAIVTGESLGQASSQTVWNLAVCEKGINTLILRPLLGMDKEEIIRLSRRIGTYEESSKVMEYCAIAMGTAATRVNETLFLEEFEKSGIRETIEESIKRILEFDIEKTTPSELLSKETLEIDFIPDDAMIIDMRSESEKEKAPLPRTIDLSNVKEEELKGKTIVIVCDHGDVSLSLAELLREKNIHAYSLKGGANRAREISRKLCKLNLNQ